MAITYKGGHNVDNFTPAFNPVNYYFDSSNKNEDGFRYVVEVFNYGTATKIFESRIAPRVGDGYAFVPLQGILKNQVSNEKPNDNAISAVKSFYRFDLKIGEEFINIWDYDDYEFYSGGVSQWNAYTQLRQFAETTAHTFVVGDQINIDQSDGGTEKPMLQGLFTVVEVVDDYTIVIDIPFSVVGSGATVGGGVKYADNRKTIFRNLLSQSATVHNGVLKQDEFLEIPNSTFKLITTSTTNRMLTNLPNGDVKTKVFSITRNQDIWMNVGNFYDNEAEWMHFENSNGETFKKSIGTDISSAIRQVGVGANNLGTLIPISGTLPLIKNNTTFYIIKVMNDNGDQLSRRYRIDIDDRCAINTVELLFFDRLGSLVSYAFQAHLNEKIDIKREAYQRERGELNEDLDKWIYSLDEGGEVITTVNVDQEYILRSYFMTDEMSVYFTELLTSPYVLMKLDGKYYRASIVDNGGNVDRLKQKKMIKKQITVKLANQNAVNV